MAAYSSIARRTLPCHRNLSSLRNTHQQYLAQCELNSHADSCALASNFVPLSFTGRACNVAPWNADSYKPEWDVPIVSGATTYTCQSSRQTYILVVNEGHWFGKKLQNTLPAIPNQLRFDGVKVADNPFNTAEPISIEHSKLIIPLSISGTTIFLETILLLPKQNLIHVHISTWLATPNGIRRQCALQLQSPRRRKDHAMSSLDWHKFHPFIVAERWRKRLTNIDLSNQLKLTCQRCEHLSHPIATQRLTARAWVNAGILD